MPITRYIIVCEGESEFAYIERLQSFLEKQAAEDGAFLPTLQFRCPERVIVKNGTYGKLESRYRKTYASERNQSIKVWADFDLYHRNDCQCAENYARKPDGIPDFLFSFHNFEDFFALHFDGERLAAWQHYGGSAGRRHFTHPLHARDYVIEIERIFPGYAKGGLPAEFVTWDSLRNLKASLGLQPSGSNPHDLNGIPSFAEFLIDQIERAYPGKLT